MITRKGHFQFVPIISVAETCRRIAGMLPICCGTFICRILHYTSWVQLHLRLTHAGSLDRQWQGRMEFDLLFLLFCRSLLCLLALFEFAESNHAPNQGYFGSVVDERPNLTPQQGRNNNPKRFRFDQNSNQTGYFDSNLPQFVASRDPEDLKLRRHTISDSFALNVERKLGSSQPYLKDHFSKRGTALSLYESTNGLRLQEDNSLINHHRSREDKENFASNYALDDPRYGKGNFSFTSNIIS